MAAGKLVSRGRTLRRLTGWLAAVAFLCQGYDQAVVNGFLTLDTFTSEFPQIDTIHAKGAEKDHKANIQGTVVSIYEIGCAIGALSCFLIGDKFGRRKVVFGASIVVIIGAVLQAAAFSLPQLIVGRIINGLGVGAFTATVPMYVSEIAHADERGTLVLLEGLFAMSGIFLATWINFGCYYVKSSANWRFPMAFQIVFALVVASTILLLPESPRWLVEQDRMEEARDILAQLNDTSVDAEFVSFELMQIRQSMIEQNTANEATSGNPFALNKARYFHRTVLAMLAMMFCQMTGTNVITFYSNTIFQGTLGYSGSTSRLLSGCLQFAHLGGAIISVFVVERFNRRPLMLLTLGVFVIIQFSLAGLSSDLTNTSAGKATLFFYFLALFIFPIGFFLIPFLYAAEVSSLRVRAKVTALAAATNWLFNFLLAMITPVGFAHLQWRYYFIYGATSLTGFLTIWQFYPETRGRSLEEIETIFTTSKSVFDTVRVARELEVEGELAPNPENPKHSEVEVHEVDRV